MQLLPVALSPERGEENLDRQLRSVETGVHPASPASLESPGRWPGQASEGSSAGWKTTTADRGSKCPETFRGTQASAVQKKGCFPENRMVQN